MNNVIDVDVGSWEREVLQADSLVVVEFWHERCMWCRMLEPIYAEVAAEYEGRARFARIEVSGSPSMVEKYDVHGTPTLILFCQGKQVESIAGFRPKEELEKLINDAVMKHQTCAAGNAENKNTEKSTWIQRMRRFFTR